MLSVLLQTVAGSSNVFRPSMRYVDKQGQAEFRRAQTATTHTNNAKDQKNQSSHTVEANLSMSRH